MKKKACTSPSVWGLRTVGTMVLVAGGLIMAQAGTPSVAAPIAPDSVPDGGTSGNGGPLAVPSLSPNLPLNDQKLIDLEFKDTPVREVLGIISKYAGINVVVGDDVTGNVSVQLGNIAPEAAIKAVARAQNLKFRKYADGTYVIGRVMPAADDDAPTVAPMNEVAPSALTAPAMGATSNAIPSLFDRTALRDPNEIVNSKRRGIQLKYVKPSIMAYWLDPQHQPVPYEMQISDKNKADAQRTHIGTSLLDPREQNAINGGLFGTNNGNFANPYGSSTAAGNGGLGQFSTGPSPYYEANPQFGGGFGGGGQGFGGGNGNGNNGNGNNRGGNRNGGGNGNGGGFDLPQGVQRLVVVDPQNLLLVQTEDSALGVTGFNELRDLISLLDQPLKQVEIEAQFVRVNTSAQRTFSTIFTTSNGTFSSNFSPGVVQAQGSFTANIVRRNFQATVRALAANGQIKIVQSPRVTAINNLTASLLSQQSIPILINNTVVNNNNAGGQVINSPQTAYINLNIGLTVTPTINNDGTVTVVLSPQIQTQNGTANAQGAPPIATSTVQTVAIVRDGDTIALGGLRAKSNTDQVEKVPILGDIPIIGRIFQSRNRNVTDDDLIIFLTARVVRRSTGDDSPVLGADTTNAPQ